MKNNNKDLTKKVDYLFLIVIHAVFAFILLMYNDSLHIISFESFWLVGFFIFALLNVLTVGVYIALKKNNKKIAKLFVTLSLVPSIVLIIIPSVFLTIAFLVDLTDGKSGGSMGDILFLGIPVLWVIALGFVAAYIELMKQISE